MALEYFYCLFTFFVHYVDQRVVSLNPADDLKISFFVSLEVLVNFHVKCEPQAFFCHLLFKYFWKFKDRLSDFFLRKNIQGTSSPRNIPSNCYPQSGRLYREQTRLFQVNPSNALSRNATDPLTFLPSSINFFKSIF